jgi:hypothetical protein
MLPSILYVVTVLCVSGVPFCTEKEAPAPAEIQKKSVAECTRLSEQMMSNFLSRSGA